MAGIGAIEQMLCEDAQELVGTRHNRGGDRVGHRWGQDQRKHRFATHMRAGQRASVIGAVARKLGARFLNMRANLLPSNVRRHLRAYVPRRQTRACQTLRTHKES
jgi:hypothetical protein